VSGMRYCREGSHWKRGILRTPRPDIDKIALKAIIKECDRCHAGERN
jgi:hypothetical protein